jgi:hypothetical protein
MNDGFLVARIDLKYQFPTPSAWRQDLSVISDRDDLSYFRFAVLQHLCDRGMLGAKPDAAARINADACIEVPFRSDKRASNSATTGKIAQFSVLAHLMSFFLERREIIHGWF